MKILKIKEKDFFLDDEDYDWIKDMGLWCLGGVGRKYAYLPNSSLHQNRTIYLHRMIMLAEYGYDAVWDGDVVVDHIDRNTYNCQKENLRLLNRQENTWNRTRRKTPSGYTGVVQSKTKRKGEPYKFYNKWYVQYQGKNVRGKAFNTPEEAAKEYDKMCIQERGFLAVLNFPVDNPFDINNPPC